MKLLRIKLINVTHRPLLNGLELKFTYDQEEKLIYPNIFVGTNGSGKSQLLETIADIFLYLDRQYRHINNKSTISTSIAFELDYLIFKDNEWFIVSILHEKLSNKLPVFSVTGIDSGEELDLDPEQINQFLPQKVIGYTSGDNETLSLPFTDYYDEYAKYTGSRAIKEEVKEKNDYEPRFYLMDYNTNIGVMISNLILGEAKKVKTILDNIRINALKSFQLVIQTRHPAAPSKNGVELTKELELWIDQLCRASSCYKYDPKHRKYILDFYVNDETKLALKHFFGSPMDFYTALYKIELLNNLIIKDSQLKEIQRKRSLRKLIIKPPTVAEEDKVLSYSEVKLELDSGDIVDYINLSDGEHQYLNIFGTILMTDSPNCLYLLDEPETHFNPKWRREFISLLSKITSGRKQDFFITSHSPFIVADSRRDQVYLFQRDNENKLAVRWPTEETYGSDSDYILKVAFDIDTSLAKKSFDEIQDLLRSEDTELIKSKLKEFGDSAEKLYLFKRLETLKSAKK